MKRPESFLKFRVMKEYFSDPSCVEDLMVLADYDGFNTHNDLKKNQQRKSDPLYLMAIQNNAKEIRVIFI
jgi:hypothetical protein